MCGSGTTLVAAARLGRRFIGGDRSPLAVEISSRRLTREGIPFSLHDTNESTVSSLEPGEGR
jgi:site-specific DNA-methyltransferase (adenine-specific)